MVLQVAITWVCILGNNGPHVVGLIVTCALDKSRPTVTASEALFTGGIETGRY